MACIKVGWRRWRQCVCAKRTRSGVLGAYYRRFIADHSYVEPLVIEQGYEVEREGTVQVWTTPRAGDYDVRIAGQACYVREIEIDRGQIKTRMALS